MEQTYKEIYEEVDREYNVAREHTRIFQIRLQDLEDRLKNVSSTKLFKEKDTYKTVALNYFIVRAQVAEYLNKSNELKAKRAKAHEQYMQHEGEGYGSREVYASSRV